MCLHLQRNKVKSIYNLKQIEVAKLRWKWAYIPCDLLANIRHGN